ncbi:MAG TPA: TetR/AcrR family transcriptional regulator [Gaiella sp.]|jgi:AcrR family transcriptional regulator|nr:TetR/AcrR family transcriptional regulator [Gaiella sp.]
MSVGTRQTAEERREAVLAAALDAFARGGLHGTSTEDIAHAAGISQPYLFRLFGTKKKLFLATIERCMADTLELFRRAAGDLRGEEALEAMGKAYVALVTSDRTRLLAQMEGYAACDDPEVRDAMRAGYGKLHLFVETVSGLDEAAVASWFAHGMLLNVAAAMDLWGSREPWARRLLEGCVGSEAFAAATREAG